MLSSHHVFSFLKNRELDELYASLAIRSFAISMVSIFVPIYLLKLNYSVRSVMLFFLFSYVVDILFMVISAKITARFGFKHAMSISQPFLILYLILLYTLPQYNWPLWSLSIAFGIEMSLYWIGFHTDFICSSSQSNRSAEVSVVRIIISSFRALGPIAGGIIIALLGFKILFLIVSILLVISSVPLFISKDKHIPYDFNFFDIFKNLKMGDVLAHTSRGVERGTYMSIWPIIIFFGIAKSYTTLGGITTAALVFSLLITFLIGKLADKKRMLIYRLGCIINTIVWLIRITVKTNIQVFLTDSVYGVSKSMYTIPFDSNDYDRCCAKKQSLIKFVVYREFFILLGYVIIFGAVYLIGNIYFSFYAAALASVLLLLL